jgi:hypothetical protein
MTMYFSMLGATVFVSMGHAVFPNGMILDGIAVWGRWRIS